MRVFLTGASGFVGSAIVPELVRSGHEVLGLARSDASAAALAQAGVTVHRGDLEDLDSLRAGVAQADGVIHAGFVHDFSRFQECCEIDGHAIEAMGAALEGSGKPLIVTDGLAFVAPGQVSTEDLPQPAASPRKSEETALGFASRGVAASVVRLPPSVHGEGDEAFVPILIGLARAKGYAAYLGEGVNRWPSVHRLDAARLYRLALDKAAAGARYHAVDDEGVTLRKISTAIGGHLGLPVKSLSPEQAASYFTWFAMFAGIDAPSSSRRTRDELAWMPEQSKLLADLDQGHYFTGKGSKYLRAA